MRRRATAVVVFGVVAGLMWTAAAVASPASSSADSLAAAVNKLRVTAEVNVGYSRAAFAGWRDVDGDGCDTRDEVLIAEAVVKPRLGAGCALTGGEWVSRYDGKRFAFA